MPLRWVMGGFNLRRREQDGMMLDVHAVFIRKNASELRQRSGPYAAARNLMDG